MEEWLKSGFCTTADELLRGLFSTRCDLPLLRSRCLKRIAVILLIAYAAVASAQQSTITFTTVPLATAPASMKPYDYYSSGAAYWEKWGKTEWEHGSTTAYFEGQKIARAWRQAADRVKEVPATAAGTPADVQTSAPAAPSAPVQQPSGEVPASRAPAPEASPSPTPTPEVPLPAIPISTATPAAAQATPLPQILSADALLQCQTMLREADFHIDTIESSLEQLKSATRLNPYEVEDYATVNVASQNIINANQRLLTIYTQIRDMVSNKDPQAASQSLRRIAERGITRSKYVAQFFTDLPHPTGNYEVSRGKAISLTDSFRQLAPEVHTASPPATDTAGKKLVQFNTFRHMVIPLTKEAVKKLCGEPDEIRKQNEAGSEITYFIYKNHFKEWIVVNGDQPYGELWLHFQVRKGVEHVVWVDGWMNSRSALPPDLSH